MINQLETLNLPKIPDTRAEDILNIVCQGRYNTLTPPKTGEDGVIQNGSMIKNLSNVLLGEKGTFGIRAMSAFKEYTLSSRQYASRFGVQIFRDIQNKVSSVLKKNPESMEQRKQQAMDKLAAIKDPKMAFEMIKNIKEAGLDVNNTTQEKLCLNLILAELRKLQNENNGLLKFIAFRRTQLVDTITRNLTDREMEFLALTFLRDIQTTEKYSQSDSSKAITALADIKTDESGLSEAERRYGGFTWLTKFITNKATLGAGASVIGLNTVLTGLGITAATSVLAPLLPFVGGIAAVGGVMTLVQAIGVADYMSFSLPNLIKIYTDPKFIEIVGRKKAAELLEVAVEKYVTETGKYNKKEMKNILRNILSADFLGADADLAKLSNISQQERTIVLQIIQNLKVSSNPVGTNEAIKNQQEAIRNQEIDKLAEPTHNSLKKIWNTLSGFGERAKNTIDNVKSKLGFEESDLLGDIKKGAKNFGLNVLEKLDTITFGKKDGLTLKDRIAPEMTKYLARQIYLENKDKFQGDPKGSVEMINKNLGAYLSEFYLTLEEITGMISRAVIEYNLYTAERAKGLAFGAGSTMASSAGLGLIFSSGVGWREIADVTTNNQWDNVLYGAGETGIKVVDKIVGTKTANAAEAQTVGQAAIETAPSQRLGAGDYLEAGNIKLKLNPDGSVAEQEIKINIPGKGQLNVKILGGMSPQETVKVLNNSAELNKTVESILATPAPAVEPPKPNNLLSQFANSVKSRIDVLRGEQPNSNPAEQQNPAMENPNNVAKVDPTFNNFNNFVQDITLKADNLIQALENRAGSEEIIRKLREFKSGQITDYAEVKDFSQATKEMRDEFLKLEKEAKELLLKEKPAPKPESVQQAAWLKLNKVLNKTTEFVTNVVNQTNEPTLPATVETNQNVLATALGEFLNGKTADPLYTAVGLAKMFTSEGNNTYKEDVQIRVTDDQGKVFIIEAKKGEPVVPTRILMAINGGLLPSANSPSFKGREFKVEVLVQSEPVVAENPTTPETPTTAEQSKNKPETSAVPETLETNVIKPVLAQIDNKIIELAGLGTGEAKNLITRMDQFRIELRNTNFRNGDDLKKATEYKNSLLAKADELLNPQVTNTATNPTQPADVSNSPRSILNKLMNGVATTAQDLRNKAEQALVNTEEQPTTPPAENSNQILLSESNQQITIPNGLQNDYPAVAKAINEYNEALKTNNPQQIAKARVEVLKTIDTDQKANAGKLQMADTANYIEDIEKRLIAENTPVKPLEPAKPPVATAERPAAEVPKAEQPAAQTPAQPQILDLAELQRVFDSANTGVTVLQIPGETELNMPSLIDKEKGKIVDSKINQATLTAVQTEKDGSVISFRTTDGRVRIGVVVDENGQKSLYPLNPNIDLKIQNTLTPAYLSKEFRDKMIGEGVTQKDIEKEALKLYPKQDYTGPDFNKHDFFINTSEEQVDAFFNTPIKELNGLSPEEFLKNASRWTSPELSNLDGGADDRERMTYNLALLLKGLQKSGQQELLTKIARYSTNVYSPVSTLALRDKEGRVTANSVNEFLLPRGLGNDRRNILEAMVPKYYDATKGLMLMSEEQKSQYVRGPGKPEAVTQEEFNARVRAARIDVTPENLAALNLLEELYGMPLSTVDEKGEFIPGGHETKQEGNTSASARITTPKITELVSPVVDLATGKGVTLPFGLEFAFTRTETGEVVLKNLSEETKVLLAQAHKRAGDNYEVTEKSSLSTSQLAGTVSIAQALGAKIDNKVVGVAETVLGLLGVSNPLGALTQGFSFSHSTEKGSGSGTSDVIVFTEQMESVTPEGKLITAGLITTIIANGKADDMVAYLSSVNAQRENPLNRFKTAMKIGGIDASNLTPDQIREVLDGLRYAAVKIDTKDPSLSNLQGVNGTPAKITDVLDLLTQGGLPVQDQESFKAQIKATIENGALYVNALEKFIAEINSKTFTSIEKLVEDRLSQLSGMTPYAATVSQMMSNKDSAENIQKQLHGNAKILEVTSAIYPNDGKYASGVNTWWDKLTNTLKAEFTTKLDVNTPMYEVTVTNPDGSKTVQYFFKNCGGNPASEPITINAEGTMACVGNICIPISQIHNPVLGQGVAAAEQQVTELPQGKERRVRETTLRAVESIKEEPTVVLGDIHDIMRAKKAGDAVKVEKMINIAKQSDSVFLGKSAIEWVELAEEKPEIGQILESMIGKTELAGIDWKAVERFTFGISNPGRKESSSSYTQNLGGAFNNVSSSTQVLEDGSKIITITRKGASDAIRHVDETRTTFSFKINIGLRTETTVNVAFENSAYSEWFCKILRLKYIVAGIATSKTETTIGATPKITTVNRNEEAKQDEWENVTTEIIPAKKEELPETPENMPTIDGIEMDVIPEPVAPLAETPLVTPVPVPVTAAPPETAAKTEPAPTNSPTPNPATPNSPVKGSEPAPAPTNTKTPTETTPGGLNQGQTFNQPSITFSPNQVNAQLLTAGKTLTVQPGGNISIDGEAPVNPSTVFPNGLPNSSGQPNSANPLTPNTTYTVTTTPEGNIVLTPVTAGGVNSITGDNAPAGGEPLDGVNPLTPNSGTTITPNTQQPVQVADPNAVPPQVIDTEPGAEFNNGVNPNTQQPVQVADPNAVAPQVIDTEPGAEFNNGVNPNTQQPVQVADPNAVPPQVIDTEPGAEFNNGVNPNTQQPVQVADPNAVAPGGDKPEPTAPETTPEQSKTPTSINLNQPTTQSPSVDTSGAGDGPNKDPLN
jgi:hypothetical protein